MAVFLRPNKSKLKNAQHYAFVDAFITVLTEAGFSAQKIVTLLGQLRTAFSEEDRYYMIARASEIVALREAADKRRDNLYGRLHSIVKAWAGSGMESLDAAATAAKKVFDLYKVNTSAQLEEETGQLDNLIADLSTTEQQSNLTALGVTWLFQQMVAAHEETKSYRLEQGAEQSEKVTGALVAARKQCDAVYDELTYLVEAFALTADDATAYETFIKKWNGSLKLYQDILDRKSGTTTAGTTTAGGGTTTDGGGTTAPDTGGSGPTGGSGTTDPDMGGSSTTDPSTGGSGTTGGSGSTDPDPSTGGGTTGDGGSIGGGDPYGGSDSEE